MTNNEGKQSAGIKSLEDALRVLAVMASRNGPASLTELARECRMQPSKVHRYLASFQRAGMVRQEGRSGRYDLGTGAMQLGLAAIARHDFVNQTAEGMPDLAAETGMTVLLAVWGTGGATVVRWERGISPTVTSMGLGTTLPLLNSATGRAFLTWAPQAPIRKLRDTEIRQAARSPGLLSGIASTVAGVEDLRARIRARGYAFVEGNFIPGLIAAAAPILDWQGEAQAVVTLVGTDPASVAPDARPVARLLEFCRAYSVPHPCD